MKIKEMLDMLDSAFPNMEWSYSEKVPNNIYGRSKDKDIKFYMRFESLLTSIEQEKRMWAWYYQNEIAVFASKGLFSTFEDAVNNSRIWANGIISSLEK